ncbi:MAG: alpha/beta hydrolase [Actinomycetota bacterium]|nr:alpha/beta hydrolase [Actinomycetota bacterium]
MNSSATPVRPAAPSPTPSSGPLQWTHCDGSFQCATVEVPIDYRRPGGRRLALKLVRRPATDLAHRIGSLLVNPGGPGGAGIDFVEGFGLPGVVTRRFDIVGFDPRGVGRSAPLDCHSQLQQMYDADPTIDNASERIAYLKVSRAYVDECAAKEKQVLPFLGTLNVARDLDRIRAAVGDRKLTYLGFSYGTSIGQMYAQLFPRKIRAMVLDGVVDTQLTGLQGADDQAKGFGRALAAYLADCRAQASCVLGKDPRARLADVIASAERKAIPAAGSDRPATPGVVQLAIGDALYNKSAWPVLSSAIQQGLRGNGTGLVRLADDYLQRRPDGSYGNGFDIYFAVSCLDSAWPHDPAKVFANAKATGRIYPLVGEGLVNDYVRCALWPVKPQPLPKLTAAGSPPIVVISTTRDPATPYESGITVARRLPKGVLITNDGDGHTVYARGKPCVDNAVNRYLVDGTPARNGLECR